MRGWWLGVALGMGACAGDKDDHGEGEGPICAEISQACHEPGDAGNAEAEACHEIAHEADEEACEAERERCVTLCTEADTGT
jgi:hypothetical protein